MKNRIFEFMDRVGLTSTEFADQIGVSRAQISSIKTGRTQPTLMLVEKIKGKFPEINVNWLIFGDGDCLEKDSSEKYEKTSSHSKKIDDERADDEITSSLAEAGRNLFSDQQPENECEMDHSILYDTAKSQTVTENVNNSCEYVDNTKRAKYSDDMLGRSNSTEAEMSDIKLVHKDLDMKADGKEIDIYNVKTKLKRTIKKIVLLYDDGSFEEFDR